jgi:hypothetical protein
MNITVPKYSSGKYMFWKYTNDDLLFLNSYFILNLQQTYGQSTGGTRATKRALSVY